ncbi:MULTISPECIES: hypothetical protein [Staphylococcus]|uniref:hypothetical protein n=1 Tax=Staphylococcus TaxID=1279 RepID=UPI0008A5C928|nr:MULTISPECIES: hypothetical protein [Staphylococcus]MBO0385351.1 hypothetical protein [Staphylococcus haemolyticus]OFK34526.1 hypothetical protein HMPREF2821_04225 [Staphylococcus sp. HMSC065C10]
MKKFFSVIILSVIVLTACNTNNKNTDEIDDTKKADTTQQNKSETKNTDVDEIGLQEFASSWYEANKRSDIEHFDELASDNIKSVINRQFMSANTENSKDFEKSVSNTKIYQSLDDENDYIVTLEVKYTNHKEKDITWLQKTLNFKMKNGKIDDFQEIGEREIFNDQD